MLRKTIFLNNLSNIQQVFSIRLIAVITLALYFLIPFKSANFVKIKNT